MLRSQGDLGQGGRRSAADAVVEEGVAAVPGGVAAAVVGVEGAAVTAPDAAGLAGRDVEGVGFVGLELEAAAGENRLAGAGLYAWPYWVSVFVV